MSGKLVILSAPSGAGKTTIVKHLLKLDLGLEFSISACSRKKRKGETDGKDYYFLTSEEFEAKINNEEFIEWEQVYKDCYYGTLKSEVERIWNNGNTVIFDVDVVGGINIKKQYHDKALSVFIKPPSVKELEKRLRKRSTEPEDIILKRLQKAEKELAYAVKFDRTVINDNLQTAQKETENLIREFLS